MATIAQEYIQKGYEQGIEDGFERGFKQGLERGMLMAQENIIRHMLTWFNNDVELTSKTTGMSIDMVSALRDREN